MTNKNYNNKSNKKSIKALLPIFLGIVVVALILVATDFLSMFKKNTDPEITSSDTKSLSAVSSNEKGDVIIQTDSITGDPLFYDYDLDGTTISLFALKASDGTIRTALNTCQVCNGSPYAFFELKEDQVQCQNCGNLFSLDMIGLKKGGCNPIPIMEDEREESDGTITISAEFLKNNSSLFDNWKKY